MITILQVSDAHLSPESPLFRANFERVARAAGELAPDVTVATGDLSLDGADRDDHLAFAAATHRTLPGRLLAVPGNHDTGSEQRLATKQPVDDTRLARWRRHLGEDRHLLDLPGWRIIGLNSELMGSGHAQEAAQAGFIAEAAAGAGERRIAVFLHRPPFLHVPEEPEWNPWSVPQEARAALAPLLTHPGLRLVASGHIHLHHEAQRGRVAHVWAPALSFYCHPRDQAGMAGGRGPGALLHRLREDHVETVTLAPPGMEPVLIDTVRAQTYPG
ncbi:metallophosphoesterase [Roseomonas sp. AR75]|uniref:metallophosphoesterase family protein n=1 Tax=Roseomonas sp. AR75 TaxID=2562311 RepID=UPI001484E282|nr:metallophosphoesterase [Roseomonas sp. AR75]